MLWIGLTGLIGSGKSTVSQMIERRGYKVISADQVSHQLVQKGKPALDEIVKDFGPDILLESGELNRKKMGQIVFKDKKKLKNLESILHPKIQAAVLNQRNDLKQSGVAFAFYDVPLLFEKSLQKNFDKIVTIIANEDIILERVSERDQLPKEEILARLKQQVPNELKMKESDYIIENNGRLEDLEKSVDKMLKGLKELTLHQPHE